ncbi:MAG: ABC transporter permease [Longimicrobiales bacterium]
MLAWREITVKYKQSVMGFMWAVLMPALIVASGVLVRFAFSKLQGTPLTLDDVALVSVKSVPWAFFISAIRFCSMSLVSNANLVAKIYMPREVFPLASILSQAMDLAVASGVLVVVLALAGVGISPQILWIPLLLTLLFLLATGIGLFVSAAGLFFRDVKYLVEVFVTFAIFFTPVFYESALFGEWGRILLLNPVAPILEGFANAIVHQRVPALGWLAYSAVASTVIFVGAWRTFRRLEPYFAQCV